VIILVEDICCGGMGCDDGICDGDEIDIIVEPSREGYLADICNYNGPGAELPLGMRCPPGVELDDFRKAGHGWTVEINEALWSILTTSNVAPTFSDANSHRPPSGKSPIEWTREEFSDAHGVDPLLALLVMRENVGVKVSAARENVVKYVRLGRY